MNTLRTGILMAAIANRSQQFSVAILYGHHRARWNWILYLQTNTSERNIFQIGDFSALAPHLVMPDHLHQFGAKQPVAIATIRSRSHTLIIGPKSAYG